MEDLSTEYRTFFIIDTDFYNRIVLGSLLPQGLWAPLPRFFQTWLRNYIGGVLLYFISGFLWCFYIYYWKRNVYLPKDVIPSRRAMLLQINVAMKAMPWYSALPTISEYLTEIGWTKSVPRIYHVGWPSYLVYLAIYLVVVEFGIYWMHRELAKFPELLPMGHIYNLICCPMYN